MRRFIGVCALAGVLAALAAGGSEPPDGGRYGGIVPSGSIAARPTVSVLGTDAAGVRTARIGVPAAAERIGDAAKFVALDEKTAGAVAIDRDGFTREYRGGEFVVRYHPGDMAAGLEYEHDGYYVTYRPTENRTGAQTTLSAARDGVKEEVILDRSAGTVVRWTVDTNAVPTFGDGALVFADSAGAAVFVTPAPVAWDAAGNRVPVATSFGGGILTCALDVPEGAVWPVTLDPSVMLPVYDDGTLKTLSQPTFMENRDLGWGEYLFGTYLSVGLEKSGSTRVMRGFLSFPLPHMLSAEACSLYLYGDAGWANTAFDICVFGASATGPALTENDYPRFDGRRVGAAHVGTPLAEPWHSGDFVDGGWNVLVFNAAGLDSIRAAGGDTIWIALISSRDVDMLDVPGASYVTFSSSADPGEEPYLSLTYTAGPLPPTNFAMTALDTARIACSWEDNADAEERYLLISLPDSTVIDTLAVDAVADTLTGLSPNTFRRLAVAVDSAGVWSWSAPDSAWTLLPDPGLADILAYPLCTDTLRIAITPPPDDGTGLTGAEFDALSGAGATDSGGLAGQYVYHDGGLATGVTATYRARLRNGAGVETAWTPPFACTMAAPDSLVIVLAGDLDDGYAADGADVRDGTVVRAGVGDGGEVFDALLTFPIPWYIQKGGVDSLFLTMRREAESAGTAPSLTLATVPEKGFAGAEELAIGTLDATSLTASWTVNSGEGQRTSTNLAALFRSWRDTAPVRDRAYRFPLVIGGEGQPDSVRAVFRDASHPDYDGDTRLTIYYIPGAPDTLDTDPGDFAVTPSAPDSLVATWASAGRAAGYVLLNAADSTVVAGTDTLAHDALSIGAGGLTPDTPYEWFVRAFTAAETASSSSAAARTPARTPGIPSVTALSAREVRFVIDPRDNPALTAFAVRDSVTGRYVDATADPDTLRDGPPGDWGWRTFDGWGAAAGDTLGGLLPDSLTVIQVKARTSD